MKDQWRIQKVDNQLDYQRCLSVRKKVFIEEQAVPVLREVDELQGENFLLFIEKEAVATGRYVMKGNLAKYERIAVLNEFRGQGIGQALMAAMEADQKKLYPNALASTSAQLSAIPFYEKAGWIALGPTIMDAGIEHRMMIKLPSEELREQMLADPDLPEDFRKVIEKKT